MTYKFSQRKGHAPADREFIGHPHKLGLGPRHTCVPIIILHCIRLKTLASDEKYATKENLEINRICSKKNIGLDRLQ